MRIGYISDWFGQATSKVVIIGETIEVDEELREQIAKIEVGRLLDMDGNIIGSLIEIGKEGADRIINLLHSQGKYILKQMPIDMVSIHGNKYQAESMTGLFLRDKSEITDIKEEE